MNGMNDDGSVLSGEALKKYTKERGLCHICAVTQTHRPAKGRILHPFRESKWEPLTIPCPQNEGDYLVYKGFCIQPTCYTLNQAQRVLGESSTSISFPRGAKRGPQKSASVSSLVSSLSSRSGSRLPQHARPIHLRPNSLPPPLKDSSASLNANSLPSLKEQGLPLHPEEDPVATAKPASPWRSLWFRSTHKQASSGSVTLGAKLKAYLDETQAPGPPPPPTTTTTNRNHSNSQFSPSTWGSDTKVRQGGPEEDAATAAGSSAGSGSFSMGGGPSQTPGPILDLACVKVTTKNLPTLLTTFSQLTTTHHQRMPGVILLDKCSLGDKGLSMILQGMMGANLFVEGLSLRDNRLGRSRKRDRGIQALAKYLTHPKSKLTDLNLSKNKLTQDNESDLFCALLPSRTIRRLNLARTKLWDVSLGAQHFYRTNETLQVLNLEGNCLQASSLQTIVTALVENPKCPLQTLLLASNALGDKGVESLCQLLQASKTMTRVSLAKNEITNLGAGILLNTLRTHEFWQASLKEITGLAENQISDKNLIINLIKQLDTIYHNRLFREEQQKQTTGEGTTGIGGSSSSFGLTFEPARQSNYRRHKSAQRGGGRSSRNASMPLGGAPPPPSHTRTGRRTEDSASDNDSNNNNTGTPSSVPKRIFVGGDGLLDPPPIVRDHSNASSSNGSGPYGRGRSGPSNGRAKEGHSRSSKSQEDTNPSASKSAELMLRNWMERTYSSVSSMVSSAASSIRSDQASDFDSFSEMSSLGGSWAGGFSLVDPTEYLGDVLSNNSRVEPEEPEEEGVEVDLCQFQSSFSDLCVNDDANPVIFPYDEPILVPYQ